ncbi:hypothetical protein SESBI_26943 [Sesbania bispinosa]|nr:hypothetical protein SESBI_26943 [Sesbania bispinosa]
MGGFIDLEELNHEFSSSTEGDATKDSDEQSDAKVVKDAIVNAGNNKGEKDANVNEVSNNSPLLTDDGNFKTLCSFDDQVEVVPNSSFTPASQHGDEEGSGVTEGNI